MNILTDILGLAKRKKFLETAKPTDVLVIGISEEPDMTGVASPVPYKDVKLIKVEDLIKLSEACEDKNIPLTSNLAGISLGEIIDPNDPTKCYNGFRRLKSLSNLFTIQENGDFVEFDISNLIIYINSLLPPTPQEDVQIPIFIKGIAKDIGKANPVGFNYPRQVIWSDHNFPVIGDGGGNYGSVFLVPFRMKIDTIRIKWRMKLPTDILNSNNDVAWDIGKLTDPGSNGVCDTEDGTINYTSMIDGSQNNPSFTSLPDLTFSFTNDNAKWPLKVQTISTDDLIYEAGDALVFLHDNPTTDWGDRDSDCEIVLSGFYTPPTNGTLETEEEEESNPFPEGKPPPENPPAGD